MATVYINLKSGREVETVDHFNTKKEAEENLTDYQMSDRSGYYYLSSRCCKDYK